MGRVLYLEYGNCELGKGEPLFSTYTRHLKHFFFKALSLMLQTPQLIDLCVSIIFQKRAYLLLVRACLTSQQLSSDRKCMPLIVNAFKPW